MQCGEVRTITENNGGGSKETTNSAGVIIFGRNGDGVVADMDRGGGQGRAGEEERAEQAKMIDFSLTSREE